MRVQCQTRELLEAVNLVASVVSSNATRPILLSVLVRADGLSKAKGDTGSGAGLLIQGTDMEVGLQVRVDEVMVEEAGAVVIPANRFHAILRESHAEQTTLTASPDGSNVEITSGKSLFKVTIGDAEEFPQLEFNPPAPALRTDRRRLLNVLRKVSVAAAKDATRFQMHSVLIDCRSKKVRIVSTDGKRMAISEAIRPSTCSEAS